MTKYFLSTTWANYSLTFSWHWLDEVVNNESRFLATLIRKKIFETESLGITKFSFQLISKQFENFEVRRPAEPVLNFDPASIQPLLNKSTSMFWVIVLLINNWTVHRTERMRVDCVFQIVSTLFAFKVSSKVQSMRMTGTGPWFPKHLQTKKDPPSFNTVVNWYCGLNLVTMGHLT